MHPLTNYSTMGLSKTRVFYATEINYYPLVDIKSDGPGPLLTCSGPFTTKGNHLEGFTGEYLMLKILKGC